MVEIIPKQKKELPKWQNILPYVSLALLVAVILSYLILAHFERKSSQTLQSLEQDLIEAKGAEEQVLETEIFAAKKRIDDFAVLIKEHQKASNAFDFFESLCHPKLWFSEFKLDLTRAQATLTGQAQSFQALDQQLSIFRKQPSIQKINLSDISIEEKGGIGFSFLLSLSPQIFK